MTGLPIDSGRALELARRSAERRRVLTLSDIEQQVPVLDSPENAKRRLAMISNWGLAGLLTASMVGAQERVHREWREQHTFQIDRDVVMNLVRRLDALERQRRGA